MSSAPPNRPTGPGMSGDGRLAPEQIDAFLDGLLSREENAAVARLVESNAALKAQVDLQHGIDRSIREQFQPPAEILLKLPDDLGPIPIEVARRSMRISWTLSRGILAAAAVLVLTGVSLWGAGIVDPLGMMGFTPMGLVSPADVYERKVAAGFAPDWVCGNDEEFKDVTRKALGQALMLAQAPGVEVVGWAYYDHVFSINTCLLFLKVDGKEVIWAVDSAKKSRRVKPPEGSGLFMKSRVVGKLVIQETNKTGDFRAMDLAFDPDKESGPCSHGAPKSN